MSTLSNLKSEVLLRGAAALLGLAPAAVAFFFNPALPWEVFALVGGVLSGLALLTPRLSAPVQPYVIGLVLVFQAMVLTAAFTGHPWQIDAHMVFFAILSAVATLRHVAVLLAAAGMIAVHHLALTMFLPALVYPSADLLENVERTVFHAVVVVVQTAVLLISVMGEKRTYAAMQTATAAAKREADKADRLAAQASEAQTTAEQCTTALAGGLGAATSGNLNCKLVDPFPLTFDVLREDFNRLVDILAESLGSAEDSARGLETGTAQLSHLMDRMGARTDEQITQLGTVAGDLAQLSDDGAARLRLAETTRQQMDATFAKAQEKERVMSDVVEAMSAIETSSSEIKQIISVIQDISFQTNLLALNAGVEAARAGESGRGFAVVASEVRALSLRTAEAADEVKVLIGNSGEQVTRGTSLVAVARDLLGQIVEQVTANTSAIAEIAKGAKDQTQRLGAVHETLAATSSDVRANAEVVSQISSIKGQLLGEAARLNETMAFFRGPRAPLKMVS